MEAPVELIEVMEMEEMGKGKEKEMGKEMGKGKG